MALGKKVKTKHLSATLVLERDTWTISDAINQWTTQDDIRVIGVHLSVASHLGSTPAMQEGLFWSQAEISRNGKSYQDGILIRVHCKLYYWTEIVIADQLAGSHGDTDRQELVMFPDGHGVDLDDGETLYLHERGEVFIMSAGSPQMSALAIIYYVER